MNQPHFGDVKLKIEVICVVRDALWGVAAWPIFKRKSCVADATTELFTQLHIGFEKKIVCKNTAQKSNRKMKMLVAYVAVT